MLSALMVTTVLTLGAGAMPGGENTERALCELWTSAHCKAVYCGAKGKLRCATETAKCLKRSHQAMAPERAAKVANCARALLAVDKCGAPKPAACNGVQGP